MPKTKKASQPTAPAETPKSEPSKDSIDTLADDLPARKTRGGPRAEAIYAEGGLADRLREGDHGGRSGGDGPPTVCPGCGRRGPGFADSDHPEQEVRCESCDHETTWRAWRRAGRLTRAVEQTPAEGGRYEAAWRHGILRATWVPRSPEPAVDLTLALPSEGLASMSVYDQSDHTELVERLQMAGLQVRGVEEVRR